MGLSLLLLSSFAVDGASSSLLLIVGEYKIDHSQGPSCIHIYVWLLLRQEIDFGKIWCLELSGFGVSVHTPIKFSF